MVSNNDIVYADNSTPAPSTHQLIRMTRRRMEIRWQRELKRVEDPLAHWHTDTQPSDLIMYRSLVLPTRARVGTFSPHSQTLISRSNAFVMYYADLPANSQRDTVQLLFGTVVTLFIDPVNFS